MLQLKINEKCLKKAQDEFVFILDGHVKQSRPNYSVPPVVIPKYTPDVDICPYLCLEEYIRRTDGLRQGERLFVSFIKPHKAIGSQTLARWIKTVLHASGIGITTFKPHSTRHAASTAAFQAGIGLDDILKKAGWSNAEIFKRFYYKHVIN